MNAPIYNVGDVVYLRESAALGFLEPVKINGMQEYRGAWVYTIQATQPSPGYPASFGDRISLTNGGTLFFSENEFVDQCTALTLAESNATAKLAAIQAQKSRNCT